MRIRFSIKTDLLKLFLYRLITSALNAFAYTFAAGAFDLIKMRKSFARTEVSLKGSMFVEKLREAFTGMTEWAASHLLRLLFLERLQANIQLVKLHDVYMPNGGTYKYRLPKIQQTYVIKKGQATQRLCGLPNTSKIRLLSEGISSYKNIDRSALNRMPISEESLLLHKL